MPAAARKVCGKSTRDCSGGGPGGDLSREPGDHGDADHVFVVERSLRDEPVLAQEMAVVGGEDDQGVFGDAEAIQCIEYPADGVVHETHHAVVGGHVFAQGFIRVAV